VHSLRATTKQCAPPRKHSGLIPLFDAATVNTEFGVGRIPISTLQANSTPGILQNTKARPPESRLSPAKAEERKAILAENTLSDTYDETVECQSAFKVLGSRAAAAQEVVAQPRVKRKYRESDAGAAKRPPRRRQRQTVMEAMTQGVGCAASWYASCWVLYSRGARSARVY
jgi:uncharacterized protein